MLVGLSTGSLRIYRVNDAISQAPNEAQAEENNDQEVVPSKHNAVDLLREEEKFSKHRIEQLAIVKEANILLSLSNGYVSTYDLQTYELQEVLLNTKGASTFAVSSSIARDSSTGVPSIVSKLAVAVKRRLLLWSWHDSELSSSTNEITLVTTIRTLTWSTATNLVVGLNSSYVLINVETSEVKDIIGPGSIGGAPGQDGGRFGGVGVAGISYMGIGGGQPKPLATGVGEGQMLLAKDINTLFINKDGESLGRRQIPWAVAPEAVGYSYPYLLALQATKGTLEVRNPETLSTLQTISLPNATSMYVPQPNISLAHAGKGFLVLSERCIWRMGGLDYDSQITSLEEKGRLDEAISLLGLLEDALLKDKPGRLREINLRKAQNLFDQHKFRKAFDLFIEVSAPPARVVALFPPNIAGPGKLEHHLSINASPGSVQDPPKEAVEPGQSDEAETKAKPSGNEDGHHRGADHTEASRSSHSAIKAILQGGELKDATAELRSFLVSVRTQIQKFLNPDGTPKITSLDFLSSSDRNELHLLFDVEPPPGEIWNALYETAVLVDTTLFRAYMFASPSLAGPLFRIDNFCDPEVVGERLQATGRYSELIDFYFGKKLHRQALELLRKFGQADKQDDLAPQLHGPQRTVTYLQNLPPEMTDLILQFAEWPLRTNAALGMEIFVADSENAETLPRGPVFDFLSKIDDKLALRYLEHIIQELNDTTPEFHQRLADTYIQKLKQDDFGDDDTKKKWKATTIEFLRASKNYQPYKILGQLPQDDPNVYEARAIVLSKMGQHRQALELYVFKIKDPARAEEYCNQVQLADITSKEGTRARGNSFSDQEDSKPSIYHALLSLYLSPPYPHKPQLEPALQLLARHGARMPASSTLELLPETLPIKDLEAYFRGRIRAANTVMNEAQIVAGMRSVVSANEEIELRFGDEANRGKGGRNRRVVIAEDRVCGVCYKRFGGSAIKVLPEYVNLPVHLALSS